MRETDEATDAAASLLIQARRDNRLIERWPADLRPTDTESAYAIQRAVAAALGPVTGWKVGLPAPGATPECAPVFAPLIHPSGAVLTPPPGALALEIEFAFRLTKPLPALGRDYDAAAVADALAFVPLIEIIGGRFHDPAALGPAEKLADNAANVGFVVGEPVADWRGLDFHRQRVTLDIGGVRAQTALGGPGDPLALTVWLANFLAARDGGLRQGDIVTTGSLQGATPITPPNHARGDWGDWGAVEVRFG
jgi:2-keto-4-pentenoate hydratase